mmetsp:Transcript_32324/g.74741  ORF Transcript_32324/g.74741 Transcript_32324/m.74741 type:complete len:161 (-) Transcript_32324:337-819(-)
MSTVRQPEKHFLEDRAELMQYIVDLPAGLGGKFKGFHETNFCIICQRNSDQRQQYFEYDDHQYDEYCHHKLGCQCAEPSICKHCIYVLLLKRENACPVCLQQLNTTRVLAGISDKVRVKVIKDQEVPRRIKPGATHNRDRRSIRMLSADSRGLDAYGRWR